MGCKDAVLRELLKNHTINCLTYEENTGQPYKNNFFLFCALPLHLHGNQRLEEQTLKIFKSFLNKVDGPNPNQFQGIHMNDNPVVEDLLAVRSHFYDIDIVDGNIIVVLARQSV